MVYADTETLFLRILVHEVDDEFTSTIIVNTNFENHVSGKMDLLQ